MSSKVLIPIEKINFNILLKVVISLKCDYLICLINKIILGTRNTICILDNDNGFQLIMWEIIQCYIEIYNIYKQYISDIH